MKNDGGGGGSGGDEDEGGIAVRVHGKRHGRDHDTEPGLTSSTDSGSDTEPGTDSGTGIVADESQPLLVPPEPTEWVAPKGFIWIEVGMLRHSQSP